METKRIVIVTFVCVGAQEYTAWEVPADMSDQDLQDLAWDRAADYAESYGVYNPGPAEDWDDLDEYEQADHDWSQVEGWWEVYDSEKHDGHLLYGNGDEIEWNKS